MEDHDEEHELSLTFYRVPIHNLLTHKSLPMKNNILSLIVNMLIRRVYVILKFFIEGEGEDEPSPGEQRISEGVEAKNFRRSRRKEKLLVLEIQWGLKWWHSLCNMQQPNLIHYAFNPRSQDDKIMTPITSTQIFCKQHKL